VWPTDSPRRRERQRRRAAVARCARASRASGRPDPLAVAATFALGALPGFLESACEEAGQPVVVQEAPYHQVLAGLLDPRGVFARATTTAGIVLLRGCDLARYHTTWTAERLAALADEYVAAFTALRARAALPMLVGFLPAATPAPLFDDWDRQLAARLARLPGVVVLGPDDVTRYYPVDEPFAADTDGARPPTVRRRRSSPRSRLP